MQNESNSEIETAEGVVQDIGRSVFEDCENMAVLNKWLENDCAKLRPRPQQA